MIKINTNRSKDRRGRVETKGGWEMSICECPTCQEINGASVEKRHDNCRFEHRYNNGDPYAYPCLRCVNFDKWEMSSCECPTCQEVKKEHWTCKHYDDRYEPQLYPCDKCRDYSNWEAKDKPIVVEEQEGTTESPVKDQCDTCRKAFPSCNGTITITPQTGHLDCLSWMPKKPASAEPEKTCETCDLGGRCQFQSAFRPEDCIKRGRIEWRPKKEINPLLVEVDASFEDPLDHAALAVEHWDGYTGHVVDYVAEAVKKISQLGGEEDETNRAIDAVVKALRFMALSHWAHGAKHERERQ